jgi:putative transposase
MQDRLFQVALRVRAALDYPHGPFQGFPNGWCQGASKLLAKYLVEEEGIGGIEGIANGHRYHRATTDDPDWNGYQSHFWLECHGFIIRPCGLKLGRLDGGWGGCDSGAGRFAAPRVAMLSRHDICDDHWDRIRPLLPGQAGGHGGVGNDTRVFLNAIRYLAKTGIGWADLPTCFGKANSVWHRYDRWCQNGVWERVAAELRDDDTEWLSVDSSCVRATVAAAGAKKNTTAPAVKAPRRWVAAAVGTAVKSTRP